MKTKAAVVHEVGQAVRDRRARPRRAQGRRGADPLHRGRACATPTCTSRTATSCRGFPIVGGHEGAGIIEEVGPGVTRRASPATTWSARSSPTAALPLLRHRQQSILRHGRDDPRGLPARRHVPRSTRTAQDIRRDVHARHVQPVRRDPRELGGQGRRRPAAGQGRAGRLRRADRLGLRGQRGRRPSRATPSSIYGIGGIGINAVQGAALAGAQNVIAVDPLENKRETAEELGATHASRPPRRRTSWSPS